ncbi:MAG: hypothetical protein CM1200mP41_28540 [Gammaproteobacteria bacterium]|nr:MAG: hypothetical protein CM1200mP41_28540 [Gammaproteobacteria bacterium]
MREKGLVKGHRQTHFQTSFFAVGPLTAGALYHWGDGNDRGWVIGIIWRRPGTARMGSILIKRIRGTHNNGLEWCIGPPVWSDLGGGKASLAPSKWKPRTAGSH